MFMLLALALNTHQAQAVCVVPTLDQLFTCGTNVTAVVVLAQAGVLAQPTGDNAWMHFSALASVYVRVYTSLVFARLQKSERFPSPLLLQSLSKRLRSHHRHHSWSVLWSIRFAKSVRVAKLSHFRELMNS